MVLVRPRLTDYHDIGVAQTECDFAIPLLDEDLPLFVDPFLLWKSPSLQDTALHSVLATGFNELLRSFAAGNGKSASSTLARLSECREAGLGTSASREGRRFGPEFAKDALETLVSIPQIRANGVKHIEVLQLLVAGIGKDRISDITCSILKSFLIDYSIEQAKKHGIPTERVDVDDIFDHRTASLVSESVTLPVSPVTRHGVLLIPKRWLRYSPWIGYDSYFDGGFVVGDDAPKDRASVVLYNRANYGVVESFVSQRESTAAKCDPDALFRPISLTSAKRRLARLRKLPSGKTDNADKDYESIVGSLLASTLHPQLDFAAEQVRTDSGAQIRDVIMYNTRTWDFLQDLHSLYSCRQLVFELKNVGAIERDHVNQLNRYLSDQFGRFGVLVTRSAPSRAIEKNIVDLWAGQRRCILVLTDEDIALMVSLYENKQRLPIEVIKKSYLAFTRLLPS